MADAAPVEAVETAKPAVPPVEQEKAKPTLESTYSGVDWSTIPEEARAKLQEEVDRRIKVARENAARRAAKERDAYWRGRESVRPEPQKPAEPAVEEPKAPTRDQFATYEEFLEAKAEFVADRAAQTALKKVTEKEQEAKAAKAKAERLQTFQSRVREKFPDIEERLEPIGHIEMPDGMGDAIAESELGPEILDYLAQNAKECERIAGLSSTAAAREIGKIEARLEKPAAPAPSANGSGDSQKPPAAPVPAASTPKQPSAAPAPIKPGGGGGPSDEAPRDSDDINEWMRKERARQRKKYG